MQGGVIGLVDEPLVRYRVRSQSLTANRLAMWRSEIELLSDVLSWPQLWPEEDEVARQSLRARGRALAYEAIVRSEADRDESRRSFRSLTSNRFCDLPTRAQGLAGLIVPSSALRRSRQLASAFRQSLRP
jgi:hypothetical protein